MRRILTIAAATVLALAVGVPAASASTAPVTQVITVKSITTSSSFHGHSFSFTESLWQKGKKVGRDAVTCSFPPRAVAHCTGVLIFPGSGDIFITATPDTNDNGARGRVVGGTGTFTNAQGKLLVVSLDNNGDVSRITLTFHI
jgi:hypothetical protein